MHFRTFVDLHNNNNVDNDVRCLLPSFLSRLDFLSLLVLFIDSCRQADKAETNGSCDGLDKWRWCCCRCLQEAI